jgi:WD40 repeat protein
MDTPQVINKLEGEGIRQRPAYAAFISYRHVVPDSTWAIQLQAFLESYRTPQRLVSEDGIRNRIGRVFLDTEEFATSNDLPQALKDALLASEKLIVICSPRSKQSEWVASEVRFFVQNNGHEKVLLFIIDGTPDESFPSVLTVDEGMRGDFPGSPAARPLAADPRPTSVYGPRQSRRLAFLRTAASLLGTGFDSLRQRDRARRNKKFAIAATVIASITVAIVFLGILTLLNRTRARANEALAYAATAAAESNEKSYFSAQPMLARSIGLNDSPTARTALASAVLLSPQLLFRRQVSISPPQLPAKFVSRRRLTYCAADTSIALVTQRGQLLKVDAQSGAVTSSIDLGNSTWAIATHCASRKLIAASATGVLVSMDIDKQSVLQRIETGLVIKSLDISPDGRTVIMGTETGLYFRDSSNLSRVAKESIEDHAYSVNAVTAVEDVGTIWAAETRVFLTHDGESQSTDLAFSDTGAILSTATDSKSISFGGEDRIVYYESPDRRHRLSGHRSDVVDIAMAHSGNLVASLGANGEILVWRVQSGTLLSRFSLGDRIAISICAVGDDLAVLSADGFLYRFVLGPNLMPDIISGPTGPGAAFFPGLFRKNGNVCIAVSNYGDVFLADSNKMSTINLYRLNADGVGISHVDLNPSATMWAALGYYSQDVRLSEYSSGKEIAKISLPSRGTFAWLSDNEIISSGEGGHLRISRVADGTVTMIREMELGSNAVIVKLAVSEKGAMVAAAQSDGKITGFDASSWAPVGKWDSIASISSLAISASGIIAAASGGKVFALQKPTEKQVVGDGTTVRFSPSGGILAVGDDQRYEIALYSTKTFSELCVLAAHQSPIWAITFTSEAALWSSEFDDCVRSWAISSAIETHKRPAADVITATARRTGLFAEHKDGRVQLKSTP